MYLPEFVRCLLALLILPACLAAQTVTTAQVLGTVTDPSGAVVPGVEIELVDTATNIARNQLTNEAGRYVFANLTPGTYRITAKMAGFRAKSVSELKLDVLKSYTVDLSLEIGEVNQTVEVVAEAKVELQTIDASVGNVVSSNALDRLPILTRQAAELLMLQPGVTAGSGNTGGTVTGARSDQSTFTLDGIDISDQVTGSTAPVIPVPVDSVEEFRVAVSNPNASFSRASGGQVALVGRRGGNQLHGAGYWYHQNDNLNANSWTRNRLNQKEPELKDNRFGFRLGGPIWRNKTFFFSNYEGRRYPRATSLSSTVPTDTLRNGILRFLDGTGKVVSYDLLNSTACGAAGGSACDPRGLGISPTLQAMWKLLPQPNDMSGGDGLNTALYTSTVSFPLQEDYILFRLDHNISSRWQFGGSYTYFRSISDNTSQIDLRGGKAATTGFVHSRPSNLSATLRGQLSPTLISDSRFGWVRSRQAGTFIPPNIIADSLKLPGMSTEAGSVYLNALGTPVNPASTNGGAPEVFQYTQDMSWAKGKHVFQFGGTVRRMPYYTFRDFRLGTSLLTSLQAFTGGSVPVSNRPPTCGGAITTNCIRSADVGTWNSLYTTTTGMMSTIQTMLVRDGQLNPLPFGTSLYAKVKQWANDFYFQDSWRTTPNLTLTYGLTYQWQTPPRDENGRQTFLTDSKTGAVVTSKSYLEDKKSAALAGNPYNPEVAFMPIRSSKRDAIFDTDWTNIAPRMAAAWQPSFKQGFMGRLFGDRKSVVRGGFGMVYDRINTVQTVIIPLLGVGFTQTVFLSGPACNARGTPGVNCNPAGSAPQASFRLGVDGPVPLPTVTPVSAPVVVKPVIPTGTSGTFSYGDPASFQVDPDMKVGRNYVIDFTLQRELPGNMILEVGYAGRLGRNLPQSVDLNSVPFFHKDKASGQTLADAFDRVAAAVRAGTSYASIPVQPWFENQLPPVAVVRSLFPFLPSRPSCSATASSNTQCLAEALLSNFIQGNVTAVSASTIDPLRALSDARLGSSFGSMSSLQVQQPFMRTDGGISNYHSLMVTLRKRMSRGLMFDINYTLSKSLDTVGVVQNTGSAYTSSYLPDVEYGPSYFDRTHALNASFVQEIPAGKGHRFSMGKWVDGVMGGWYVSGIFTAESGLPMIVSQSAGAFGGGASSSTVGAIPVGNPGRFGNSAHQGINGSGGVGVLGNPASGGSGINLFADPEAVLKTFRPVSLTQDGRSGRANPLRGFPRWNLDASVGKRTKIRENVSTLFTFDFFNALNHVNFDNPSLSMYSPSSFGVVTRQNTPGNRIEGSRWIQFGLRVEF